MKNSSLCLQRQREEEYGVIEKRGGDRGRGRIVGEEEGKEKDGEVETVGEEVEIDMGRWRQSGRKGGGERGRRPFGKRGG